MSRIINDFNIFGYLSAAIINVNDRLKETNVYSRNLKYYLNQAEKEFEKATGKHFLSYQRHGKVEHDIELDSMEIYKAMADPYDYIVDMLGNDLPSVIASKVKLLKQKDAEGYNLGSELIEIEKMKL